MKMKLHLQEKFFINEEAKLVVCVLTDPHYSFYTTRGKAKCSPSDAFDVEYGKKLARQRAEVKMQKKVFTYFLDIYNSGVEEMNRRLADVQREHAKFSNSVFHLQELESQAE